MSGVDADVIAEKLIGSFGSLREVIAARPQSVERICGQGEVVDFVGTLRRALTWALLSEARDRPRIGGLEDLLPLLRATIGEEGCEHVLLLMVDTKIRLIRAELVSRGTPDQALFACRDVLTRCIDAGAAGFIIAHNHPSGIAEPSVADRDITFQLAQSAKHLGTALLDHVIVTRGGHFSFRAHHLI